MSLRTADVMLLGPCSASEKELSIPFASLNIAFHGWQRQLSQHQTSSCLPIALLAWTHNHYNSHS